MRRPSLKRPPRPYPLPDTHKVRIWTPHEMRKIMEHKEATDEWICDALEYLLPMHAEFFGCPGCGMVGKEFCRCEEHEA